MQLGASLTQATRDLSPIGVVNVGDVTGPAPGLVGLAAMGAWRLSMRRGAVGGFLVVSFATGPCLGFGDPLPRLVIVRRWCSLPAAARNAASTVFGRCEASGGGGRSVSELHRPAEGLRVPALGLLPGSKNAAMFRISSGASRSSRGATQPFRAVRCQIWGWERAGPVGAPRRVEINQ